MMLKFPLYQPRAVRWIATASYDWEIGGNSTSRMAGKVFRLNSPRDPIFRTGAAQRSALGFATMALLYNQYRVYFTTLEARWFPRDDQSEGTDSTQHRAWADGQVLFIETGRAGDTTTLNREVITDSIQERITGTNQGFWSPATVQFPNQLTKLQENGAQFQGANRWKMMAPRHITATGGIEGTYPLGRSNKSYGQRIAMSWRMANLNLERTKEEFKSDLTWGAAIGTDPAEVRLAGVGWGNASFNPDAIAPSNRPVVGGYMQVKMKFYTILSHKRVVDDFALDTTA